jgi:hypothetical protein
VRQQSRAARRHPRAILGPATVVVASGGMTAAGEPKLHLHWRLAEPTSDTDEHARLKRARILATAIVGGDATNVPAVHPIRWPGSWHRKGAAAGDDRHADADREIILSDALEQLEAMAPAILRSPSGNTVSAGDVASLSSLISQLISGEAMHAPLVALAYRYLKGGMADAQVCADAPRADGRDPDRRASAAMIDGAATTATSRAPCALRERRSISRRRRRVDRYQ